MKLEKLGPVRTYCNGTVESGGSPFFAVYRARARDDWRLLRLRFQPVLFVFGRAFPFVGNDACGGRRNSGLPRRSPGLRALVQNLFPFFHPGLRPGF